MASSRTTITAPGRLIFGLMITTVTFTVIGGEIEKGNGQKPTVNPLMAIFGGTMATSFLILISHAGEAGERFGTGLAVIAFTSSALVYGKPVWDAANKAFGSQPTGSTGATTPTKGTATAAALAPAVAGGL